eukprot:253566-Amphidinium_carterae.1
MQTDDGVAHVCPQEVSAKLLIAASAKCTQDLQKHVSIWVCNNLSCLTPTLGVLYIEEVNQLARKANTEWPHSSTCALMTCVKRNLQYVIWKPSTSPSGLVKAPAMISQRDAETSRLSMYCWNCHWVALSRHAPRSSQQNFGTRWIACK